MKISKIVWAQKNRLDFKFNESFSQQVKKKYWIEIKTAFALFGYKIENRNLMRLTFDVESQRNKCVRRWNYIVSFRLKNRSRKKRRENIEITLWVEKKTKKTHTNRNGTIKLRVQQRSWIKVTFTIRKKVPEYFLWTLITFAQTHNNKCTKECEECNKKHNNNNV